MLSNLLLAGTAVEPIEQSGLVVNTPIMMEPATNSIGLAETFMAGGWWWMTLLTLTLVCALFAAWKAPAWVRSLGRVALAIGVLSFLMGVSDIANAVQECGNKFPLSVYMGGVKVALIAPIYSIIVYVVVTLVDLVRRPRI